ncbi:MAG: hypothetical protein H7Y86_16100 [Rhizobacter sp.]|nr:hypothetical protein [Ferruginibacter sp.]
MNVKIFAAIVIILFTVSCNSNPGTPASPVTDKDTLVISPAIIIDKDSLLTATGKQILVFLKSKQYDSLVTYFSPTDSVHFSPYGFIGSGGQTLSAHDFATLLINNKIVNWGEFDGSGDPIHLTLKQYIEKFVYNADFLNADRSAIDSFIGTGNSVNTLKKVYPNSRFIEYYFPGFDKKYGGMDWTSLRLVFKEQNERYYVIALVHDQWTI